jgi:sugar O-acyltransferase (sialic acid O-acetyltransferase NeuD family)
MNIYAVYGASGCGRGIMPLLRQQVGSEHRCLFIDDNLAGQDCNGQAVISYADYLAMDADIKYVSIAIANSTIRQQIAEKCLKDGLRFHEIRAMNVIQMDDVQLGQGALLSPFVTLTSNIRIGGHFHANLYSYVEHDCMIGDFVTFAPGVKCNGNVVIEDHAYIGTGAVIKQGKPGAPLVIGKGAVVGMGAVVTKSVPPGVTVVGNPARILDKA